MSSDKDFGCVDRGWAGVASFMTAMAFAGGCNNDVLDTTDIVVHEVREDVAISDRAPSNTVIDPGTSCPIVISYDAPANARIVAAAGLWNDFSATATPLIRPAAGAAFSGVVQLHPGEYPYKIVTDGVFEDQPPRNIPTHWHEGVENRNLVVADCHAPSLTLTAPIIQAGSGAGMREIRATLCAQSGLSNVALAVETMTVTVGGVAVEARATAAAAPIQVGICVDIVTGRGPGKHTIRARIADVDGKTAELFAPIWVEDKPFDWRDASLYMAMVDRFVDSDGRDDRAADVDLIANHIGGDFAGLKDRISAGYLDDLGVNALWLAPVQTNAAGGWIGSDNFHRYTGYHGYWPISAAGIDPRLAENGAATPEAAFDALVKAAHDRGIRVVLDVVLNHVHEAHDYCVDTPEMCRRTCVCGQDGCDWDGRALDCQFAAYLPDLDYRNHDTVRRVLGDVMAFVAAHDIDALRIDAVKHVDRVVLSNMRARIDAIDDRLAPFWLVGETFTGAEGREELMGAIGPGTLDGQFDFPLYWTIRETFVDGGSFRDLEGAVAAGERVYGAALPLMSPFAGNHDVERLATALARNDLGPFGGTPDLLNTNGDSPERWDIINPMSMALAFTLSLRGVPLLYAGDEVGLAGSADPDNRRMMPLTLSADRAEILKRVTEVGQLRRDNAVIRRGDRREIWIDDDLYVQARWLPEAPTDGSPRLMIIGMNRGETRTITVTIPDELGALGGQLTGMLSGRVTAISDRSFDLTLGPWEYVFLKSN